MQSLATHEASPRLLQAALDYAKAGMPVFPLHPHSKVPATPNGFYSATTDTTTISQFFADGIPYNLGVPTGLWRTSDGAPAGGLVVVDVDGDEGFLSLQSWIQQGILTEQDLSETLISTSNRPDRKSISIWFAHPGVSIPCSVKKVAPGIDIRGEGGYMVVPPSIHPTGSSYTWANQATVFGAMAAGTLLTPFKVLPVVLVGLLSSSVTTSVKAANIEMPGVEEVEALLEGPEGGKTEWYKRAKRKLKGREYYPNIFENKLLASEGNRNTKIVKMAGQVVSMLFNESGTTPQLCFALIYKALEQVSANAGDDPDEDFISTGWSAILRMWAKEESKTVTEQEEKKSFLQSVIDGARSWCDDDVLHGRETQDDEGNPLTPADWVSRNLIVYLNNAYFIMNRYGYYCKNPVSDKQIVSKLRENGMDKVISLTKTGIKGEPVPLSNQEFINRHSSQLSKAEGLLDRELRGAWVVNMGNGQRAIKIPLFHRKKDLTPAYDPRVDAWLRRFFGEHYSVGIYWIACALAFEEGAICALSIVGDPACGKKLFMQGLAECINTEVFADDTALTDEYRPFLLETGFLNIDEGLPSAKFSKRHIPDIFRRYTSGEPLNVNAKWKPQIMIHNPLRIVMTANNHDILKDLTGGKHISKSDKMALCQRILHIDVPKDCSAWLESQGGYSYTEGWVKGEGGIGSNYTLAKHFLWLHDNLKKIGIDRSKRFLVMGNLEDRPDLQLNLTTRTDASSLIVETIVRAVTETSEYVFNDTANGEAWVTAAGVLEYFRFNMAKKTKKDIDIGTIDKAMRHLITDTKFMNVSGRNAEWHKLDLAVLIAEATRFGYNSDNLRSLYEVAKNQNAQSCATS